MFLIYVAGPYTAPTHSGIDDNIRKAEKVSIQLFNKGWSVFTPHKNSEHYEIYQGLGNIKNELWLEADIVVLKRCDAIFMMKDWEKSPGAIAEHTIAKNMNIEIFYEKDGFPDASKE